MSSYRCALLLVAVGLSIGVMPERSHGESLGTRAKSSAFALGAVTRTGVIKNRLNAEFGLGRGDGLRAGERLLVVRPALGNVVIDEIEVSIVGDRQSVGRTMHAGRLAVGDVVIFHRILNLDATAPVVKSDTINEIYAEISFGTPPRGESRKTFNARVHKITWEGVVDIREIEADVYMDHVRVARMTVPARSIQQMRLNGMILVVDRPKGTIVAAAIHDYRELLRADIAQRERIELAKARILSDERVRIAALQVDADARVRIAAAEARAHADAQIRLAEISSREEIERERLSRERIADNASSHGGLDRALTAVGGLLQVAAYLSPEYAAGLGALSGGAALLSAIVP